MVSDGYSSTTAYVKILGKTNIKRENMNRLAFCITIVFMTMVFSSIASADSNICLANNSQHTIYKINSTGGVLADVIYNDTCHFGCNIDTGLCNTYDSISFTVVGLAILFIASFFAYIATKISAGFTFRGLPVEVLQPLFFSFSFLMILLSFNILMVGSNNSSQGVLHDIIGSGYNIVMYIFMFYVGFMVISFIYAWLNRTGKKA